MTRQTGCLFPWLSSRGKLAEKYLDALRQRNDVQITAVCDADRRAAEQIAAGWVARVYSTPDSMLAEGQPDALWICVPPGLQADVLLKAIERRIPFFICPPGASNFATAKECAALIDQARLVTAVGYSGRDADVVQEAREYLGANVVPLALGWWLAPPQGTSAPAGVVDQLWSDASGMVDAMRCYCGNITRVRAITPREAAAAGGLVLQMEFAKGTVGMLTCATFARPEPRIELELLGESWSLRFGRDFATLQLDESDKTTILRCMTDPAVRQTTAFLLAVAQRTPPRCRCPTRKHCSTLAVCHAAKVLVEENREVDVENLAEKA